MDLCRGLLTRGSAICRGGGKAVGPTRATTNRRRQSCDHRRFLKAEVGLVGRALVKARIGPARIIERQISADRRARLGDAVIGAQVDHFVFDAAPQPLDGDIVAPGALAVHAERDFRVQQNAREVEAGELADSIDRRNGCKIVHPMRAFNASAGVLQSRALPWSCIQRVSDGLQGFGAMLAEIGSLGKYCRSSPLVFSFVPRCHGLCGSQK